MTKKTQPARTSSVGARMIAGLTEVRDALKAGQRLEERFTIRTVDLDLEPKQYSPEEVRGTRKVLKASQAIFAKIMGVSVQAVRAWEQGIRLPSPMACRLLDEINFNPKRWIKKLRDAAAVRS